MDGRVIQRAVPGVVCQYEKADTRTLYHIKQGSQVIHSPNILVKSNDSDALVILMFRVQAPMVGSRWTLATIATIPAESWMLLVLLQRKGKTFAYHFLEYMNFTR